MNNGVQIAGYSINRFVPDELSIKFVQMTSENSKHLEAEALMSVIAEMNLPIEIVNVKPGEKVTLPRSKAGKTQVWYAGKVPMFTAEGNDFGAEAVIPEGTVIQVIFSDTASMHDEQMKIFTTL